MRYFTYSLCLFFLSLSKLGFSLDSDKKMFESYVRASLNLYFLSPECFFPYNNMQVKTGTGTRRDMRELLCSERMTDFCETNSKMVEEVFESVFDSTSLRNREFKSQCSVSPELEKNFQKLRRRLVRQKDDFLESVKNYLEEKGLKQNPQEVLKNLRSLYSSDWAEKVVSESFSEKLLKGRNKILLSQTLLRFARDNYYELEDMDLIEAFYSEQKNLKKEFLSKTKEPAVETDYSFGLDKMTDFKTVLKYSSFLSEYRFDDESMVEILKSVYVPNLQVIDFMMKRRLQRVMWHLRSIGEREKARYLERKLKTEVLAKDQKLEITGLNLGFTESYRVYFPSKESVVYKPESKVNIASGSREEVAAYIVDRMLNLNMVPLTFLADYKDGQMGSSQYFVEDARVARSVGLYTGREPKKLGFPSGRNTKTPIILLFDWLISNRDRNLDNYMFLDTGKVVFIDHGMTFRKASKPHYVTKNFVKKRLPTRELYEKMKALLLKKDHIVKKLSPYLSENKIQIFYKKLKLFTNKVTELLETKEVTLESEGAGENVPA